MAPVSIEDRVYEELKAAVEKALKECGGYGDDEEQAEFIIGGSHRSIKKAFRRVEKEILDRWQSTKKPNKIWPFNDDGLRLKKGFQEMYFELERHNLSWGKAKDNELIEVAGGRPFRRDKYPDGKHGDVVIRPDTAVIEKNLGVNKRTVYRYISNLVQAGVLLELRTNPNEKGLYVIGDWQGYPGGHKLDRRINRTALRESIRKGLLEQKLASE